MNRNTYSFDDSLSKKPFFDSELSKPNGHAIAKLLITFLLLLSIISTAGLQG